MNSDVLLKGLSPCGLVCYTCVAAKGGITQEHARKLLNYLESFDIYAEKLSGFELRLKKYREFNELLHLLGEANCEGCRDGVSKLPGCGIAQCIKEKGVDFCFECPSFPCDKADFEPLLKTKWLKANKRMKKIGVETYFQEVKDKSHYA